MIGVVRYTRVIYDEAWIPHRTCPDCGKEQYTCPVEGCFWGGWRHFGSGSHSCAERKPDDQP